MSDTNLCLLFFYSIIILLTTSCPILYVNKFRNFINFPSALDNCKGVKMKNLKKKVDNCFIKVLESTFYREGWIVVVSSSLFTTSPVSMV